MKTLKQLREDINKVGPVKDTMPPGSIRKVKTIARQMSNAVQPNIPQALRKIEDEISKYGYTLGDFDVGEDFDETGEEDFAILAYPNGDPIRNVYLTVKWNKTSPVVVPQVADVLQYSVRVLVNIIDPEDFDDLMNGEEVEVDSDDDITGDSVYGDDDNDYMKEEVAEIQESGDYNEFMNKQMKKHGIKSLKSLSDKEKKDFFNKIDKMWNSDDEKGEDGKVEESVENLEEAVKIRTVGKSFTTTIDEATIVFDVLPTGINLNIGKSGDVVNVAIKKNDADKFMTALMDHYIDNK